MKKQRSIFDVMKALSVQDLCFIELKELERLKNLILLERECLIVKNEELIKLIERNKFSYRWVQVVIKLKHQNGGSDGQ